MANVYLEKVAKIVEKYDGVRHEVGTPNFFVNRSTAEEWIRPKDEEHRSSGRKIIGTLGAIAFAAPPLASGSLTGTLVGAGLGGLVGMGLGHVMANSGSPQDREDALIRNAKERLSSEYGRELDIALRKGYKSRYPNVTLE